MTSVRFVFQRGALFSRRLLLGVCVAAVLATLVGLGGFQLWRNQQYQRQLAATQAAPAAGLTSMDIRGFAFAAPHIQVRADETVTWRNADDAQHDVTFRNGAPGSGALAMGGTWSYAFAEPGTYDYFCGDHPYMAGRVTVVR